MKFDVGVRHVVTVRQAIQYSRPVMLTHDLDRVETLTNSVELHRLISRIMQSLRNSSMERLATIAIKTKLH
jgi:hypothetical protein